MHEPQKTILIVDDEDAIRNLAALVLEAEGYRVLKARHSDEALLLMDSHRETINLLLTDVRMDPYLNGCELAKCMRLLRPDIQVLYISGYTHNAMVQQEVEDQRAYFLPKPFSPRDLVEKVNAVMNSATV
jgi:two-component system, cell cycle sensor histidine kinase and response regulator CckA